jgi:hypothetical protein
LTFIYFNIFQIRTKCRSKRNDIAASIRHAVFTNFGERVDHIDNNASAAKIVEWKSSERTKAAYKALFSESELLDTIGHSVFKQYRNKELPTTHCAYVIAICDILLNPKSPRIKCNDKSVVKRVDALLVNIFAVFHILYISLILQFCNYLLNSALLTIKPLLHQRLWRE